MKQKMNFTQWLTNYKQSRLVAWILNENSVKNNPIEEVDASNYNLMEHIIIVPEVNK